MLDQTTIPEPTGTGDRSEISEGSHLRTTPTRVSVGDVPMDTVGQPAPTRELSAAGLGLVLIASFMVVLDFSIVNVALPSIHRALGFGGDSVQWVVTAYAITFGGLLMFGGRVADIVGRRRMFVIGLSVFVAASLAAGATGDAGLLIAARAVQGIGAAIVAPASLSLITAHFVEGPRRTRALGLYGATASIGFVAGQVLGGVLVEYASWRWIFLVNVPVGLGAMIVAPLLLAPDRPRRVKGRIDVGGGMLSTIAIAALVFGVSEGPVLGWASAAVDASFLIAAAGSAGFIAIERSHVQPLVDLALLRQRGLRTAGILTLLLGIWTAGELVVLSLYLQQSLHDSPLVTGLIIAPQGIVGFMTGVFGARLMRRLGIRWLLVLSTLSSAVGFALLSHLPTHGPTSPVLAAVVFVGFGTVGTIFATTVLAARGMADRDQGLVGGVVNTTRQVGAAIGVALLVAIADGSHARTGTSTVSGDRTAMLAAAAISLIAAIVAWQGTTSRRMERESHPSLELPGEPALLIHDTPTTLRRTA